MPSQCPKTPPSSRRLGQQDNDKTPKSSRKPPQAALQAYAEMQQHTPPRRNSFEEIPVSTLPDPRTPEDISFADTWTGPYLEFTRKAAQEFLPALEMTLLRMNQYHEYERFVGLLKDNANHGTVILERIIQEACTLFGHHEDLVHAFNDMLPPGYRMETRPGYVAVFTPNGGWNYYRGGKIDCHPVIPSSTRSP